MGEEKKRIQSISHIVVLVLVYTANLATLCHVLAARSNTVTTSSLLRRFHSIVYHGLPGRPLLEHSSSASSLGTCMPCSEAHNGPCFELKKTVNKLQKRPRATVEFVRAPELFRVCDLSPPRGPACLATGLRPTIRLGHRQTGRRAQAGDQIDQQKPGSAISANRQPTPGELSLQAGEGKGMPMPMRLLRTDGNALVDAVNSTISTQQEISESSYPRHTISLCCEWYGAPASGCPQAIMQLYVRFPLVPPSWKLAR